MKFFFNLLMLLVITNSVFAGLVMQAPPAPPIDPFGDGEGEPVDNLPVDMILYPLLVLGSIMMVYLVKYKKILFN